MNLTRREFVKGGLAALGFLALPGGIFAAPAGWKPKKKAKLVVGVMSDTHLMVGWNGRSPHKGFPLTYVRNAFELFKARGVDAVVHCGDAAHRGAVREWEFHKEVFEDVFGKRGTGISEDAAMERLTGAWTHDVAYGLDGRAYIFDDVFTPNAASTGNVVTVETKAQFYAYVGHDTPDATAQAAVRLGTNGCFQVWAGEKSGVGSGGVGELGWVDVEAEGVVPVNGAEYTLRTTFDYSANTYSVAIKNNDAWLPLTSSTPNSQLSTSSFPLAAVTNCISSVGFVGETYFTSLLGDCRYEIIGFVADEALALSNNVEIVLSAAKATWLNKCGGDKAAVQLAASGLSEKDFTDAYLLNLDITNGDRSYTFAITDIDVGDTSVSVAVTLTRSGSIAQPINGVLNPTFHVHMKNPGICWSLGQRSSLHFCFRRISEAA